MYNIIKLSLNKSKMSNKKDSKDAPKDLPVYGPELQIVPQEEKGGNTEDVEDKRQIIDSILEKEREGDDDEEDAKLPWVKTSDVKSERGQA